MTRSDLPQIVCPECGAANNGFASHCWICRHPLVEEDLVDAQMVASPESRPREYGSRVMPIIALVILVLTTFVIGIGMALDSTESLIGLGIVVLPAAIGCGTVIYQGSHSENKWFRGISMFLSTLIVTVSSLVLLAIAGLIALIAFCYMLIVSS